MLVGHSSDPGRFKTLSAAGCHPDPEKSIWSGLLEVAAGVQLVQERYEAEREKALLLLEDSDKVREMHDHALLYALPEAFPRLRFLFERAEPAQTLEEAFPDYRSRRASIDLTEDLLGIVESIL